MGVYTFKFNVFILPLTVTGPNIEFDSVDGPRIIDVTTIVERVFQPYSLFRGLSNVHLAVQLLVSQSRRHV